MYLSSAFLPTSSECFADINSWIPGLWRVVSAVSLSLYNLLLEKNKAQSSQGLRKEPGEGVELLGLAANYKNASSIVCFYWVGSNSVCATNRENSWVWWSFHFGYFSSYLCFPIMVQILLAQLLINSSLELSHKDLTHIYDTLLPQATPGVLRAPKAKKQNTGFTKEVRGCLLDKFSWRPGIFTLHCYWKVSKWISSVGSFKT